MLLRGKGYKKEKEKECFLQFYEIKIKM